MANNNVHIALNYVLKGRGIDGIVHTLTGESQVIDLRELVCQKVPHDFSDGYASNLTLWMPNEPVPTEELKTFVNGPLKEDIAEIATELSSFANISEYFPSQPDRCYLHIIVTTRKRVK